MFFTLPGSLSPLQSGERGNGVNFWPGQGNVGCKEKGEMAVMRWWSLQDQLAVGLLFTWNRETGRGAEAGLPLLHMEQGNSGTVRGAEDGLLLLHISHENSEGS